MAGSRAKWRMLFGIAFLLGAGVLVLCLMAVLELVYPPAGITFSNCWWYGMVKFWKAGGAVVLVQSHYTTLPHFWHTFDFQTYTAFNPPSKRRRFLPPPLFFGTIVEGTLAEVLAMMDPKAAERALKGVPTAHA